MCRQIIDKYQFPTYEDSSVTALFILSSLADFFCFRRVSKTGQEGPRPFQNPVDFLISNNRHLHDVTTGCDHFCGQHCTSAIYALVPSSHQFGINSIEKELFISSKALENITPNISKGTAGKKILKIGLFWRFTIIFDHFIFYRIALHQGIAPMGIAWADFPKLYRNFQLSSILALLSQVQLPLNPPIPMQSLYHQALAYNHSHSLSSLFPAGGFKRYKSCYGFSDSVPKNNCIFVSDKESNDIKQMQKMFCLNII